MKNWISKKAAALVLALSLTGGAVYIGVVGAVGVTTVATVAVTTSCNFKTVLQQIQTWLPTIVQAIQALLNGVAALQNKTIPPQDVAAISAWGTTLKGADQVVQDTVLAFQNANGTLAGIQAAYSTFVSDLSSTNLLAGLHIVDQATLDKVQAGIGIVGVGIDTVGALIAELNPSPTARQESERHYQSKLKALGISFPMTLSDYKSYFNKTMQAPTPNPVVNAAFKDCVIH
jgi:hypothetical protein